MFVWDLGDGIALRPFEEHDADELYRLVDDNRAMLARWMPWAGEQTPADSREFIATSRRQWAAGDGIGTAIVIDGAIGGSAGITRIDRANRVGNVGYWLSAGAQGRGAVTRAVSALLDYGFDTVALHRVELRAGTENAPSRAVARRLGFTEEGVLREAEWVGDRWIDHVVHSMLADEWTARARSR